jgi:hypothetical protein
MAAPALKPRQLLKINLPFLPPSWNKVLGGTIRSRCRLKDDIKKRTALHLPNNAPTFDKRVLIHFLMWTHSTTADADNFSPKWIIDTIVDHGILQDDRLQFVHGVSLQGDVCPRDVREHTIILIQEMDEQPEEQRCAAKTTQLSGSAGR